MTNENEPDNLTLRLLREMRDTMDGNSAEMRNGFAEMHKRFDDVDTRLDRLEQVCGGLGFFAADARGEIEAIKARLDALETRT